MLRFATLVVLCFSVILPQTMAFAQADSCRGLQREIRSFERNSNFRNYRDNYNALRETQKEVKEWESQFVRRGCQKALNAGKRLDSTCRSIGRKIQRERNDYANLVARVQQGAEVAKAREQALQQYARLDAAITIIAAAQSTTGSRSANHCSSAFLAHATMILLKRTIMIYSIAKHIAPCVRAHATDSTGL